jgi:hypothetical protein
MEAEFTRLGFMRDISPDAPICRWRYRDLEVDLMPTDPAILGLANRWYPLAVSSAQMVQLPNGIAIRLITAPLFVATKFEAFTDRGKATRWAATTWKTSSMPSTADPSCRMKFGGAPEELRIYLAVRCAGLLALPHFMNYLPGLVAQDEALTERVTTVATRLQHIAALLGPDEAARLILAD